MSVKIESVEHVYKGWSTLSKVTFSDGDARFTREVEDHGQAVAVLPFDAERRVALLIQLPRTPVMLVGAQEHLLEAPAGLIDDGESEEAAMRREAQEEAGVDLATCEKVGTVWSSPGVSTERITLFLAPYTSVDRTGAGGGLSSEHENIAVAEHQLTRLAELADSGRLTDMKTFLLVQTLRLRRPELFA